MLAFNIYTRKILLGASPVRPTMQIVAVALDLGIQYIESTYDNRIGRVVECQETSILIRSGTLYPSLISLFLFLFHCYFTLRRAIDGK